MQQQENRLLRSLLAFLLLFISIQPVARAQNYAVQVIPQLLPPYSLNLTDYYTGSREKLAVTLINRDLQKPMLQVRLRMSIESQNVVIRSRDNVYYPPIDLDPGIPFRISLGDLAPYFNINNLDFQGITRMQYQQGAKLPDGLYRFNFEAVEYQTGRVVSQKSYSMAWLSLSDPPLINLPRKGETIAFREPTNIIFNWTPRHMSSPNSAFNTQYEFSLVEIWDNGVAPESAFLSAQPLYQTTTNATTLLYGPGEPPLLPGKRYAWRVKAQAKDGADDYDLFRNQGYSEIYWFTQSPDCKLPQNIKVAINGAIATLSWDADFNKLDYIVEYREKDKAKAEWFSQKTIENRMPLYDLKPGKTYEYRIGGTCNGIDYVYADIQNLTTETPSGKGTMVCGLEAKFDIANKTPIQTLNPGETILAGDFPVKLTEVFSSPFGGGQVGASFSGKGYITVPFIGMLNIAVAFNNIKVNTDRQLIDGQIVTVYDVTEGQIANADSVVAQVKVALSLAHDLIDKLIELSKNPIKNKEEIASVKQELSNNYADKINQLPISEEEKKSKIDAYNDLKEKAFTASDASSIEESLKSAENANALKELDKSASAELIAEQTPKDKDADFGKDFLLQLKELILAKKPFVYTRGVTRKFISPNVLLGDESLEKIDVSLNNILSINASVNLQEHSAVLRGDTERGIRIGDKNDKNITIICKDETDKQKLISYLWGKGKAESTKAGLVIFANGFKIEKELGVELTRQVLAMQYNKLEVLRILKEKFEYGDIGRNYAVEVKDQSDYWEDLDDAFLSRIGYKSKLYVDGSYDMNTRDDSEGFSNRVSGGRKAGQEIVRMLATDKKIMLSSKEMPIEIVAHSMGYAYALGVIETMQKAGYKIGMFYAIAPENPGAGYVPQNIEGIWQYGTNENDGLDWLKHDQIAPQVAIKGITEGQRVYIPDFAPKGPIASHSISNYGWIFGRNNSQSGYVEDRK